MAKDAVGPIPPDTSRHWSATGNIPGGIPNKLLTHNIQKKILKKKKNQINTMLFRLYEEEKGKNKILGVGVL